MADRYEFGHDHRVDQLSDQLLRHITDDSNPHNITAALVGAATTAKAIGKVKFSQDFRNHTTTIKLLNVDGNLIGDPVVLEMKASTAVSDAEENEITKTYGANLSIVETVDKDGIKHVNLGLLNKEGELLTVSNEEAEEIPYLIELAQGFGIEDVNLVKYELDEEDKHSYKLVLDLVNGEVKECDLSEMYNELSEIIEHRDQELFDRLDILTDRIELLTDTILILNNTILDLNERIKELEEILKKKDPEVTPGEDSITIIDQDATTAEDTVYLNNKIYQVVNDNTLVIGAISSPTAIINDDNVALKDISIITYEDSVEMYGQNYSSNPETGTIDINYK